jgi:hypothetical protein
MWFRVKYLCIAVSIVCGLMEMCMCLFVFMIRNSFLNGGTDVVG